MKQKLRRGCSFCFTFITSAPGHHPQNMAFYGYLNIYVIKLLRSFCPSFHIRGSAPVQPYSSPSSSSTCTTDTCFIFVPANNCFQMNKSCDRSCDRGARRATGARLMRHLTTRSSVPFLLPSEGQRREPTNNHHQPTIASPTPPQLTTHPASP
jgi:hypothetical protein